MKESRWFGIDFSDEDMKNLKNLWVNFDNVLWTKYEKKVKIISETETIFKDKVLVWKQLTKCRAWKQL
jgi:hypothetical protein